MKKSIIFIKYKKIKTSFYKKKNYQKMTTLIIFFMIKTRLNIIFTTLLVNYLIKNLNYLYIKVVKTILKYLKGFKKNNL